MPKKIPKTIQLSPKARKMLLIICAILVFLFALGLTLYPLVSNWYNSRHQSEIHTQYLEVLQQIDNSNIILAKRSANAYNTAIAPGIQLSDAFSKEALLLASEDYESLLNLTGDGIMGYIEIPLIQVNLPIYHGTDSKTLDIGVGHLLGSSLPVGGKSTHTVLTGHSGMAILFGAAAVIIISVFCVGGSRLQKNWRRKRANRHKPLWPGKRGKYEKD